MIQVGSIVSEGTLRKVDLLENFSQFLCQKAYHGNITQIYRLCGEADAIRKLLEDCDRTGAEFNSSAYALIDDHAEDILERLRSELDDIAPEGTYFGTQEGDGACFGFFPAEEEE